VVGITAVIAGTATAVSNRVSRRQAERWALPDSRAYPAVPQQGQRAEAPPPQPDLVEELKHLGELRDSGVLTDAEFGAQKAKILTA
jgi:hypothetical protein